MGYSVAKRDARIFCFQKGLKNRYQMPIKLKGPVLFNECPTYKAMNSSDAVALISSRVEQACHPE